MSEPRTIWQVGGGPANRDYSDLLLRHGVALIGPSGPGEWNPERSDEDYEGPSVRHFAEGIQIGDILLLRLGRSTIRAVGLIPDDAELGQYRYMPQFEDVNGWGIPHCRRVRWCPLPESYDFGAPVFGANPRRVSRVNNSAVVEYAERFVQSPPTSWQTAPLPILPEEEPDLEEHEAPPTVRPLLGKVGDLANLYEDSVRFGALHVEDEMVAHYVIPLLEALGWKTEHIAVKWEDIDVAVFADLPRTPENCRFIIEAKRLNSGIEGALDQAKGYLKTLGITRKIVLTDGLRYRLYEYDARKKDFVPVAYANLWYLKESAMRLFELMKKP